MQTYFYANIYFYDSLIIHNYIYDAAKNASMGNNPYYLYLLF